MREQVLRTLHSLSRPHQVVPADLEYDIVVVDNGSTREPLDEHEVRSVAPAARLVRVQGATASPVAAVNTAVDDTAGEFVGVVLDGACLVTPGIVRAGLLAQRLGPRVFATSFAWHLGPDIQQRSTRAGYGAVDEARALRSVGWPDDGYSLFRTASIDPSNAAGWFGPMSESRFFVVPRHLWVELGGFDERFVSPGGGLASLDFFRRAALAPGISIVGLLGEGTFHQVHGGITTGPGQDRWDEFHAEYERIVGAAWRMPDVRMTYLGQVEGPARAWLGAARVGQDLTHERRARGSGVAVQGAQLTDAGTGFFADGWVARDAVLSAVPSRACRAVEVVGWVPADVVAEARMVINGALVASGPVGPGVFMLSATVDLPAGEEATVAIDVDATVPMDIRLDDDERDIAWQGGVVRFIPSFVDDGVDYALLLQVHALEWKVKQLTRRTHDLGAQLDEAGAQLDEAGATLHAVYGSRGWRLLEALRSWRHGKP